jgi:hypothetical protein
VSAVKMTMATAQTIHCAVLLFMITFRFDSSDRLSNSITAYINWQLITDNCILTHTTCLHPASSPRRPVPGRSG